MKKRLLCIILSVAAWMVSLNVLASYDFWSYDRYGHTIYFDIKSSLDNTVYVVKGPTEYSGNIGLPEYVIYEDKKYSVADVWTVFQGNTKVTSIELPSTITHIDANAFEGCTGLTSVSIPNSVTGIGDSAFKGCTSLKSISIPESVKSINIFTFYDCSGLTSVTIPNSVTTIGYNAFDGCSSLTSIDIPNSVTSIGSEVFKDCTKLASIQIPESVLEIGYDAFSGCTSLPIESIYRYADSYLVEILDYSRSTYSIKDGTRWIGSDVFNGCTNLTSITLPESLIGIGMQAFLDCSQLSSISIPKQVRAIGSSAFKNCRSLKNLILPDSLLYVHRNVFENCNNLSSITIPNKVSFIGYSSFSGCANLASITIPNSVKTIEGKFVYGSKITSILIPYSVESIDGYAFSGCNSLTDITVQWKSPVICSFQDYPKGSSTLHVPAGTIDTYKKANYWNDFGTITEYTLAKSISLNKYELTLSDKFTEQLTASVFPNTAAFKSIIWSSNNPSVANVNSEGIVTGWNSGTAVISAMANDGSEVCAKCIVTVVSPIINFMDANVKAACVSKWDVNGDGEISKAEAATVTNLGAVFKSNSKITSLTDLNNFTCLTNIGNNSFCGCSSLTSITIPSSVSSIGEGIFTGCSGLTSIDVNSSNTKYDSRNNCNAIIETSSNTLVAGCKNTIIPSSVTSIKNYSFASCFGLMNIAIPNSVISIGEYAFDSCSGLTDFYVNWATPISVSTGVFSNVTTSGITLHVPAGTKSLYEAADVWKDFGMIQETIINVSSITLSNSTLTIAVGETTTLTTSVLPDNASDKSVTWSSSNESVATVSAEGVVTAISAGNATITAIANDVSGVSASCEITVKIEPSTDISQYDYVLYFDDIEARAGTSMKLGLNLKNAAEDVTAFECKVVLPDHVTWATTTDKRGNIILVQPTFNTETERTDASYHTISTVKQMTDGSYYIIVYSDAKEYILDNDGAVLDIPIVIDEEIESGDYNIVIKNLVITKTNTTDVKIARVVSTLTVPSYELGDANGDTFINVSDIVTVISYMMEENPTAFIFAAADVNADGLINVTDIVGIIDIMMANANEVKPRMANAKKTTSANKLDYVLKVAPLAVEEGASDLNATLDLINKEEDITAFECKVYLPEGIEWKSSVDKRGKVILNQPSFNAAEERTDANYHTINTVKKMDDGGYYIIVYSDSKEYILGNSGAVLDLPLKLSEGTKAGVYDIKVDGMVIAHTDGTDIKPSAYSTSVIVGKPSNIAINGEIDAETIGVYKNVWEKNENLTSIDLSKATDIADGTEFKFTNPNTLVVVPEGTKLANENNVIIKSGDEYTCQSFVLTDGKPFAAPTDFTATSATYSRELTADYGTICLPYAPSTELYDFFELGSASAGKLNFKKVDAPKADTPYLYAKKGSNGAITGQNVSISTGGVGTAEVGEWQMKGAFKQEVLTDNVYFLSGNTLYRNTGTLTVSPFRGYFVYSASAVKSVEIFIDDSPTGIMLLEDGEVVSKNAQTYNLSGQKVDEAYKGVVIVNGKKIVNR